VKATEALEIQSRVDRVLWGKSIVEVQDCQGETLSFVLRSLTSHETNFIDFVYRKALRQALEVGIMTEDDLLDIHREDGTWTEDDETILVGMSRKIDILNSHAKDFQNMKSKVKKIKRELAQTKDDLQRKENHRATLFSVSAENYAEELRRRHMVGMVTENMNGQPYWAKTDNFLKESDLVLVYNLAFAYFKHNILNEEETRKVARCGAWRYRWQASKNGADLFGKPISEWSEMQSSVIYWSQFYDFVYESADRPSEPIIEDDSACDAWYKDQVKKMSAKSMTGSQDKNAVGTKKAKSSKFHQEHFIMVEPGDNEAVQQLQDMNTSAVRRRLQAEHKTIKESKVRVSEWRLRKGKMPS